MYWGHTHTEREREMEAAGKKLVLVVVAFITVVALAVVLLVGVMNDESVPQSIESDSTEETFPLEEEQAGRRTRQSFEFFAAIQLQRWCTNRGSIVMKDTECTTNSPCEGTSSFCLWKKCCCRAQVCDCLNTTCMAVPEAVKLCADDGKCRKECNLQFFLKGVEITSLCETFTRVEIEAYVESYLCSRNCYEGIKPCEREPCLGAPYATCENHCEGYCVAKYILKGVDITGFCYLDAAYIESYVEMVQKARGVTADPTDTTEGDQGESGSGSGSVINI